MKATLYLRVSLDRTGEELAVTRQEALCRELCTRMGWEIGQVFTDNSVSATSGKARPGFEALIKAAPDLIVMWSVDRLVRVGPDLERLISLDVPVHSVMAGPMDLSTASGRLNARLLVSVASFETEIKSERQRAALQQRADMGKAWFNARPFGYAINGEVIEAEAALVKAAYEVLLDGGSLRSIARAWNEAGVLTPRGNTWDSAVVGRLLGSPRYAAIRTYRGREVGPATWPPIVDVDTYRSAARLLSSPGRRNRGGGPRRSLLGGIIFCSVCGGSVGRSNRRRKSGSLRLIYHCVNGCASLPADTAEEIVGQYVIERLALPDASHVWEEALPDTSTLREEVATLTQRLGELGEDYADGSIGRAEFKGASVRLRERLEKAQGALSRAEGSEPLSALLGAADVASEWASMGTERQRIALEAVVERVVIRPRGKGNSVVTLDDVGIVWRTPESPHPGG